MDLLPSPEQLEIIDSSSAFLRSRLPITRTRELIDGPTNIDPDAWAAAAELGWFALGLPESVGGVGCGLADEAILFREIGRSLAAGPFLASVLAARVAAFGGAPALADEIIAGRPVGLVVPVSAEDVLLVDVSSGLALVTDTEHAAIIDTTTLTDVTDVPCLDDTTRLQRAVDRGAVRLARVAADVDAVQRRGHVLAAAMLTGIAEAARDLSAEHAKVRVQFDKPIGVNQAIKHPCADMAVRAQLSLAQTLFAALAHDEGRADAEFHGLSAHLVAAEAAELGANATVQVMGGMGFTFEHDSHLYAKRAHVLGQFFGGTQPQLARLLSLPAAS